MSTHKYSSKASSRTGINIAASPYSQRASLHTAGRLTWGRTGGDRGPAYSACMLIHSRGSENWAVGTVVFLPLTASDLQLATLCMLARSGSSEHRGTGSDETQTYLSLEAWGCGAGVHTVYLPASRSDCRETFAASPYPCTTWKTSPGPSPRAPLQAQLPDAVLQEGPSHEDIPCVFL